MSNHTVEHVTLVNCLPKSSVTILISAAGSRLGGSLVSQINVWLSESGVEWTVQRLKAIRTAALNLKSASIPVTRNGKMARGHKVAKAIYQNNSISYHKKDLCPSGPFYQVVKGYVEAKKPQVIRRYALILRIYTSLLLPDLSEKQYQKAKGSINHLPNYSKSDLARAQSYVVRGWQRLKETLPGSLFNLDGSVKVGEPDLRRLHPFTSVHCSPTFDGERELKGVPYGKWARSFATVCAWPRAFRSDPEALGTDFDPTDGIYPYDVWAFIRHHAFGDEACGYVGRISFLQEAGAKARVVAIPAAALQWGFEPLHRALDGILRYCSWSCIHDQNRGAEFLTRILGHREVAGCVDLSDATNNFPRSLQIALLNEMGLREWGEALDWVAQGEWYVNTSLHGEEAWSYGTGQPMGLYGSFPLFSLTYICMLLGLYLQVADEREMKGKPLSVSIWDAFRDVGDDIIVFSQPLTNALIRVLNSIGCPVAEEKSIISRRFGEFAGFEAHRTHQQVTVFRPYKFGVARHNQFVKSGVSLLYSLGPRVCTLGKYWKKKWKRFYQTRAFRNPDLSPMFSLSDKEEVYNDFLDVPRLTQLLQSADALTLGPGYSPEEFNLWQLECLAEILLNEEESEERPVLEFEEPEKVDSFSFAGNISTDPFMNGEADLFVELLECRKPDLSLQIRSDSDDDLILDLGPDIIKRI